MTPLQTQLRAEIAASPTLKAMAPDTQAIADSMSAGRMKFVATEVGNGTILEVLGLDVGNALLDLIYTNATFKYVKPMVEQGRLRLDSQLVRATLQSLVGTALTQAQADALIAKAQVADPVSEFDVRCAIFNDNGTLAV